MDLVTIAIVGLVALVVAGGALLTLKIRVRGGDRNKVTIKDVSTTGDVAGRDINKRP